MSRSRHRSGRPTRPVWFLMFDGVQSLDVTGPYEVFAGANEALRREVYVPRLVSVDGGVGVSHGPRAGFGSVARDTSVPTGAS